MLQYWPVSKHEVDILNVRQEIRVKVVKAEQYDPEFPTGSLEHVVSLFKEIMERVPEEYKNTAQVDFESVSSYYDSHYCEMTVLYRRPETDEEWEARKANVAKRQRQYEQEILRQAAEIKKTGVSQ